MIYSRILFAVDSIYPLFSGLPDGQIRLNTGAIAWRILPGNSGLALVLRTLRFAMTWARLGIPTRSRSAHPACARRRTSQQLQLLFVNYVR